jgi:hypothetical protein
MTEWLCKRSFLQAFSVVITFGSSTGGSGSSTGGVSVVVMRSAVHSKTRNNRDDVQCGKKHSINIKL